MSAGFNNVGGPGVNIGYYRGGWTACQSKLSIIISITIVVKPVLTEIAGSFVRDSASAARAVPSHPSTR